MKIKSVKEMTLKEKLGQLELLAATYLATTNNPTKLTFLAMQKK